MLPDASYVADCDFSTLPSRTGWRRPQDAILAMRNARCPLISFGSRRPENPPPSCLRDAYFSLALSADIGPSPGSELRVKSFCTLTLARANIFGQDTIRRNPSCIAMDHPSQPAIIKNKYLISFSSKSEKAPNNWKIQSSPRTQSTPNKRAAATTALVNIRAKVHQGDS